MEDVRGFHGTRTTTTTQTSTRVQTNLRFDPSYLKRVPGILKCVEAVLALIVFICGVSANSYWRHTSTLEWTYFVSMTAFWVTGILLVLYLFHVMEKFHVIPWALIEMIYCALWCIFFTSGAIDCAVNASRFAETNSLAALSFFAFCAAIVYGYDAFLKFKVWKANELVQGQRWTEETQQTTTA